MTIELGPRSGRATPGRTTRRALRERWLLGRHPLVNERVFVRSSATHRRHCLSLEVELVEARVAAVRGEVDGGAFGLVDHEGVAMELGQPRRHDRAQEGPLR